MMRIALFLLTNGRDGRFGLVLSLTGDTVEQRARLADHGAAVWFWRFFYFIADVQMDGVKIRRRGSY